MFAAEELLKPGENLLVEQTVSGIAQSFTWNAHGHCLFSDIACALYPLLFALHDKCRVVQVDPRIMGGMVVDIGDKHIDMSISSRVKKIQQLVMQTV